jgi:hypothetical protein
MNEIIETTEDGRYRVRLFRDEDAGPANPRTRDDTNLVNVITLSGQGYINVDEDFGPLAESWERVKDHPNAVEVFTRYATSVHGATVMYDRPYDGADAIWYFMPEKLSEVGPHITAEMVIKDEIEEYQRWREDEIYAYVVEENVLRVKVDRSTMTPIPGSGVERWEKVDEAQEWGLLGYESAAEEARLALIPYGGKFSRKAEA